MAYSIRGASAAAFILLMFLALPAPGMAGEIVNGEQSPETMTPMERGLISRGRSLFLRNCAHCHADDATGDEGPNLHGIKQSDAWLEKRIRKGIKGEMPAFQEKFNTTEISALIQFIKALK